MQALMSRFLRGPVLRTIPIPVPEPDEVLIQVSYVSLNPTDYKLSRIALPPGKVIGCDFSGIVKSLGSAVDQTSISPGDRVAGVVHGSYYTRSGAFAEYLVADPNLCFHVPGRIPLSQACTFGVGWISAMQALHQRLYKDDVGSKGKDDTLLVYSAATNMGMHTLQLARLEHPESCIIALASPQHHEMLRSLGASEVFDYRSPSVVADVRKLGRDIYRGIDCHSEGDSSVIAARCMVPNEAAETEPFIGKQKRRIIRTLGKSNGKIPPSVRADESFLAYTVTGKPFWLLFMYHPASKEDYNAGSTYIKELTKLLDEGKIVPVKSRVMQGGLGDIAQGFAEMKAGRVRGEKLVYRVAGEERDAE